MLITTIVSTGSHPSLPPTGAADNGSFREKRKDLWRLVICSFFLHPSPHHFFCRRTEGRERRRWVLSCHHRDTEAGKCLAPPGTKFPLCACALSRFSGVRLCDPMDGSPPGSFVHGILQARTLEWVSIPSSRGSSRPRDHLRPLCLLFGRRDLYQRLEARKSFPCTGGKKFLVNY